MFLMAQRLMLDDFMGLYLITSGFSFITFSMFHQIVLTSMASLEVGFSHDIFVEWAADSKNLVFFTERGQVCYSSTSLINEHT